MINFLFQLKNLEKMVIYFAQDLMHIILYQLNEIFDLFIYINIYNYFI